LAISGDELVYLALPELACTASRFRHFLDWAVSLDRTEE
jgi:hypothetical protein